MWVGGNVVLVHAAVSFHQCNSQSTEREVWCTSVIRKKTCNLGTSYTLLPWFKLMVSPVYWLNGWVPTMKSAGEIPK